MNFSNIRIQPFTITLTLLIAVLLSTQPAMAQTSVTSNINTNTTWDLAGSPYIVENNISIGADDTLTIEPSVEVRFETNISVSIFGHLQADSVLFTSNGTNNRGGWGSIRITQPASEAGSAEISNSTIEFADRGAVFAEAGTVTLIETEIRNSTVGLRIGADAEEVIISNLTITGNQWPIEDNSLRALQTFGDQLISGNDHNGVRVEASNLTDTDHSIEFLPAPYVFENNVTIDQNAILKIIGGNILKFGNGKEFKVDGTLLADGSNIIDPIQMTSLRNDNIGGDTNNDGTGSSPSSGDWRGVVFSSTAQDSSLMDNVEISFAGQNSGASTSSNGAITLQSASPTVRNCTLLNSFTGFVLTGTAAPTLENNEVGTSELFPLMMTFNADPTLTDNVLSLQDNAFDAIGLIGSSLSGDATLVKRNFTDVPNITYVMFNDLEIPAGTTLNVEEGVVVKAKDARFVVKGTLNVNGTETSPAVFTSVHDDSEGNPTDTDKNGNATVPDERDWDGFVFDTGSDASVMDFATIRYTGEDNRTYDFGGDVGRFSPRSAIIVADASPTITNTDISQTDIGVTVIRDGTPTIQKNTFTNTLRTPVALSMSANPAMSDNNVSNAGLRAIGLVSETVRFDGTISRRSLGGFENITYAMLGSITIANGTSVNIEPGVVIKGSFRQDLFVEGALNAVGDDTNGPVIFTSIKDDNIGNPSDTNNDGNGSAPEKGDWGTIAFRPPTDDANSLLNNLEIRFGIHGVVMNSASVSVSNTIISDIEFWGFSLDGDSSPVIENVTLQNIGADPIALSVLSNPSFDNIVFNNTGTKGLALLEGQGVGTSRNSNVNRDGIYLTGSSSITADANLKKRSIAGIENIPYVLSSDITIGSNSRLTLDPGIILKFSNRGADILVDGAFIAEGTEQERIFFTSIKDDSQGGDTNNDGNNSQPGTRDWSGIKYRDSSIETENIIKHATIRFATSGSRNSNSSNNHSSRRTIDIDNSFVLIDSVTIEQFSLSAISIKGNSNPIIRNSQFLNIDGMPVITEMFSEPLFENNFMSNTIRAIGIDGQTWTNDATVPKRSFAGFENITYLLTGDITIGPGTTITIPEGVVFKSWGRRGSNSEFSYKFNVEGTLRVLGTELDPVVFTHIADDELGNPMDTENNGNQIEDALPLINSWIIFKSGSDDANNVVDNAVIRYRSRAGTNNRERGIQLNSASPTIKNTHFEFNNRAIVLNGISEPILTGNVFHDTGIPVTGSILSFPSSVSGNQITGSTFRAIGIEGETLVQDFTLTRRDFAGIEGIPYFFRDTYTVGSGAILTIEPGVIMKFPSGRSLNVKKGLIAEGTLDSMIVFTAIEDDFYGGDTNADSSATSPESVNGHWRGITYEGQSLPEFSKLDYAIVRYAAFKGTSSFNSFAGVNADNASPTITNSILQRNRYGVKAEGSSNPVINNNDIFENREFGVWNVDQTFTIDATNNWWGSDSGPTAPGNPGGTGDAVSEGVSFIPFEGSGSTNPQPGDVSLNGSIQAFDGSLILKDVVGLESLSAPQEAVADVSGDSTVSAMDASFILQFIVGKIESFPVQRKTKTGAPAEPLADYEISDVELTFGEPELLEAENQVRIPVKLKNVNNLYSFSVSIGTGDSSIQLAEAKTGEMLHGRTFFANQQNGTIHLALASDEAINSDGTAAYLHFDVADQSIAQNNLTLNGFKANEQEMERVITSAEDETAEIPEEFELKQNFPNPFNPSTTISFALPEASEVTLEVFNTLGRRVAVVANSRFSAGQHAIQFDASSLSSGLYLYRIRAAGFVQTRKMMLIK